ncbi:MAG: glycine cleavage system protein GcvH [Nitrospinaceae bacterium]|jgi:glycine cleavage system H protein|nr:glycine cleavage system protein GcvH [Nitrospinaceae bacterium]MBT3435259.1 glycine cleavage system protein GcvH [Nitrospinaceae bacterium]MBT3821247.1 glycine cleavage system protein GcvH [Nitrospinaceae bacterium]MBT4092433.1 glycine cleavage system protein GcvH [Nitrospinaceae bacterium]MBT4429714.1 glycine cleavage system protein GcvH [Nitrospinaceae bacterium]
MEYPTGLKYSREHEWVKVEGNIALVGISDFAQDELGDVVYVELPDVGTEVEANNTFGVVESVKAVSDLYSPVTGTVTEVNDRLNDEPELVNSEPYEEAWMLRIEMSDATEVDGLLDADEYKSFVEEESA